MKQFPNVKMSSAEFLRSMAFRDHLPELAAIAEQLDDYEEMKPLMHYYVTAYARMKSALEMIAQTHNGRCCHNIMEAMTVAKKALRYAEDQ